MTSPNQKPNKKQTDRRAALKLGGLALLGAAALATIPDQTAGAPNSPDDTQCCGTQTPDPNSAFVKACKKESADKYDNGDNDNTYRIVALWLLLTTEDWSTYIDKQNGHTSDEWLAGVAKELQLPSTVVSDL